MANQRTSKSIAERIDTDYYKRAHPIRAYKRYLAWGFFGLTLFCLLVPALLWDHRIFQAAPVSSSHRLFADECWRCHTESFGPMKRLVTLDDDQMSVSEQACRACHDTAGHSPLELTAQVPHCARCHREHRPAHPLVAVADAFCTDCHADLRTSKGSPQVSAHIGTFGDHPEFAVLSRGAVDASNLAFNHRTHLNPQGIPGPDRQPVQLDCQSCHEPDSERRYMQPIRYERHCGRCHANSLAFDPAGLPGRLAPHGDAAAALASIRQDYADQLREHPAPKSPPSPTNERFNPARPHPRSAAAPATIQGIDEQVLAARQRLFEGPGGCRYCHQVTPTESGFEVNGARPPNRWLTKSVFRHNSHRLLACQSCHAAQASTLTGDVLLPSIEVCRQCHNPQMSAHRAVRTDCVACHEYHDHARDFKFDGPLLLESLEKLKLDPKTTTPPGPTTPPPAGPRP